MAALWFSSMVFLEEGLVTLARHDEASVPIVVRVAVILHEATNLRLSRVFQVPWRVKSKTNKRKNSAPVRIKKHPQTSIETR